jgi:FkbM family methyltransferase
MGATLNIFGFGDSGSKIRAEFLNSRQIDLVIDVGANKGQYAKEIRKAGYKGRIISFEPVTGIFNHLSAVSRNDNLWDVRKSGVGASEGTANINISYNSVYSSFLEQTDMAAAFSKKSAVVLTETVPVIALDDMDFGAAQSIFLKIDTQGYEKEVLAGAKKLLNKCQGIQLELPVEHLYAGVWSFTEAVTYMDQAGFVPAQFQTVNPIHDDPCSAIEFDCIFRRKRPTIDG